MKNYIHIFSCPHEEVFLVMKTARYMLNIFILRRMSLIIFICASFTLGDLVSCSSYYPRRKLGFKHRNRLSVTLSWQPRARTLAILSTDLQLATRVQSRPYYPYSDNAYTAIWIGVDFPHDKASQMILWSKNYYQQIRYLALSDFVTPRTNRFRQNLFIGGSTRKALQLSLKPWSKSDFRKLKKIQNKKDFHSLVRSKYGNNLDEKTKKLL